MRVRYSARIIVVNALNEVLLIKYEEKAPVDPTRPEILDIWCVPGGAVDEGESYEQAALRELREETGISAEIGPLVWTRKRYLIMGAELTDCREMYFLARFNGGRVDTRNSTLAEEIVDQRWWTLDEIRESSETFVPIGFAELLAPLLGGEIPSRPIAVDSQG